MENLITRKPWLLIVGAFVLLIAAWSVLIYLSVNNAPALIPMEQSDTGILPVTSPAGSRSHT